MDIILSWLEKDEAVTKVEVSQPEEYSPINTNINKINEEEIVEINKEPEIIEYVSEDYASKDTVRVYEELKDAEDDLLINTNKESQ